MDEPTYQLLRTKALEEGVAIAALIREILHQHLGVAAGRVQRLEDFRFVGSGSSSGSGIEPIFERHDEALGQDFAR